MDLLRALPATLGLAVAGIAYGAEAGSDAGADALRTAGAPEARLGTIEVIAERFDKARNPLSPKYVGVAREIQASWPGKLGIRLSIVNLCDKSYKIRDGTGVGVGAPQFGPHRSVYGTLSATF